MIGLFLAPTVNGLGDREKYANEVLLPSYPKLAFRPYDKGSELV